MEWTKAALTLIGGCAGVGAAVGAFAGSVLFMMLALRYALKP